MFYAHIVLAKKGPLARIWLAAHWDKKLTKAHVFETNIEQSIEGIMQPKVKLALRTSGHLLLGVVRIYSRKAKYLLADCNEAFVKIKMAFRPGVVDLPEEHREAAVNTITLPEVFHDFDTALPELNDVDIEAQFSINQSRADEITMREDYGTLQMNMHDDGFGDIGFEPNAPDIVRNELEDSMNEDFFAGALNENIRIRSSKENATGSSKLLDGIQEHLSKEFTDTFEQPAAGLFEGDIFGDGPIHSHSLVSVSMNKQSNSDDDDDDDDGHFDGGAPSPIPSSENSRACTPGPAANLNSPLLNDKKLSFEKHVLENTQKNEPLSSKLDETAEASNLLINEEESFALAPIDAIVVKGWNNKSKRKRKLIVDEIKNISGDEMKNQLANTTDIVTTLDLAPPTKRLMYWKETGGVEKLFALPSRDYCTNKLFLNYQRQLITKVCGVEDFSKLGSSEIIIAERNYFDDIQCPSSKKKRKQKITNQNDNNFEPEILREHGINDLTNISVEQRNNTNKDVQNIQMSAENHNISDASDNVLDGHFTPSGLDHGGITPNHCIENIESIPNLHVDQVSSILNASSVEPFSNFGFENVISPEKASHEWDGDYDYPQSTDQTAEEQGVDETMEQFEERVLNKRAAHLFISVRSTLQRRGTILLSDLTINNNRKQAAQKFYSILVLKKFQVLNLEQEKPYSTVVISKGSFFDNPKL